MSRAVVVGAGGFVGSHVCEALEARGVEVVRVSAPRLAPMSASGAEAFVEGVETADEAGGFAGLLDSFRGADAVINAAGDPDASSRDGAALIAANGALPGLLGRLAEAAGVRRFVHVSSAVVQGRRPVLDASDEFDAFSAYAKSKALGERFARRSGPAQTVCYRPPSVHHESRRVTQLTARIAASPGLRMGVPPSTPKTPTLVIVIVPPAISAGWVRPSRAVAVSCPIASASWRIVIAWASLTFGTTRPRGVAAAMPRLT